MNWQLSEQIPEYRDEMEVLLTQVPLGGSQYLKWRFDLEQKRPLPEWIPIDNMLLPYATTNFYTSQRATEVQDITEDIYMQRVEQGIYRDIEDAAYVSDLDADQQTRSQKANDKIEGKEKPSTNIDGVRRVYEITCFERLDDDPETEGRRAPYMLTIDESSGKVLSLYRNWAYGDDKLTKLDWIVEFKFIPWRGAYAIGLPHLIGGLSAALTGSLRALLDSAHISNSQTMLKLKGGRMSGQSDRIEPTQVVEIEGSPGVDDVRKLAMPLPFNQPSSVLFNLLGWLTTAAKGVVSTAEEKIGEINSNAPVGTTQALIEQGAKVFSSIHARLHRSQAKSLAILSRINHWYLEEMDNQSGTEVEVRDFADNNDVRPVSDPNIFSETQRLAQNQAVMQMAATAPPGMFDMRAVYGRMLRQLKVPGINEIMKDVPAPEKRDSANENVAMMLGQSAFAYMEQDHLAHIQSHMDFYKDPIFGSNPMVQPIILPQMVEHIKQHLSMWYLNRMNGYVTKTLGRQATDYDDPRITPEADKLMAIASQHVTLDTQKVFAQVVPELQGMMQTMQKLKQGQTPPMTPEAQVLLQTSMAETQRLTAKDQADNQLAVQKLQNQQQLDVAKLTQSQQQFSAEQQLEVAMQTEKNLTQERIESARLTRDAAKLQQEQVKTATELQREAQSYLGG
jgi:hypothetical protein